ncbi:MAG: ATP-binding protein, partial [Aquihabitans sp.]
MQVGRRGLSPVMVGRAEPLDRLLGALDRPEPGVVLIGGEAGIGKSRLVEELRERLDPSVLVVAGQAEPGGLGHPFGLFLDALGSRLPGDDRLARLRSAEDRPDPDGDSLAERTRVARELLDDLVDGHRAVL